ncbi:MAG: YecR family lipoprotein [Kluyvera sp.]|uniref:YecR family lipoprotein n=1 Tax=Kluyvera sp. TaxID=1538228 RepID=UPI003A8545B3
MKSLILIPALLALTACSIPRTASVSEVDATSGIVRLTYGQAVLQNAYTDNYLAQSEANKACQQMGYATAFSFGQPITTCSTISGSLCLNEHVTLQYQCRGIANIPASAAYY